MSTKPFTKTDYRYEVGSPETGLVDAFPTKAQAFWCALLQTGIDQHEYGVFDCMARFGQPNYWVTNPPGQGGIKIYSRKGDPESSPSEVHNA